MFCGDPYSGEQVRNFPVWPHVMGGRRGVGGGEQDLMYVAWAKYGEENHTSFRAKILVPPWADPHN